MTADADAVVFVRLRFPSPEDLILFKILAGRDKDILDATGVARRHAGRLDVAASRFSQAPANGGPRL